MVLARSLAASTFAHAAEVLDDLAAAAGGEVEWRTLLRELDRLAQVRMRASDKDWLIRTWLRDATIENTIFALTRGGQRRE